MTSPGNSDSDIVPVTPPAEDVGNNHHLDRALRANKKVLLITGRAGTGKSTLLRKLVTESRRNLVVLAPTGAAAVEVSGQTIHSFFRFKPGITLDEAWRQGEKEKNNMYKKLEVLVIDEISMVRADLLDCIDVFLQAARKSDEPFGGVQVVMFGDPYQLEPVVTRDEKTAIDLRYKSPYFFHSDVFRTMMNRVEDAYIDYLELQTIYRQSDQEFIGVLDHIRKNTVQQEHLDYLNQQVDEYLEVDREGFVYLTTTNDMANRINRMNMEKLGGEPQIYSGRVLGDFNTRTLPVDMDVELKPGARIMMVNNDPYRRWVNGSLGYIMELDEDRITVQLDDGHEYAVDRVTWSNYKFFFDNDLNRIVQKEIGSYEQYPVRLAWAMTIHKSQGKTFDNVAILLQGRAFAYGQLYVALSRARTKEGIRINRELREFDVLSDKRVAQFMTRIKVYRARQQYPVERIIRMIEKSEQDRVKILLRYCNSVDVISEITAVNATIFEKMFNKKSQPVVSVQLESGELREIPLNAILSAKLLEEKSDQLEE